MKRYGKVVSALLFSAITVSMMSACGSTEKPAAVAETTAPASEPEADAETKEEKTETSPNAGEKGKEEERPEEAEPRVLENGYVLPEGTLVKASAQSGRDFIYNMENLYVVGGYSTVYMDEYELDLLYGTASTEDGADVYLSLDDLNRIYGPDFEVTTSGNDITITHAGLSATVQDGSTEVKADNGTFQMDYPVRNSDGILSVPVVQFMERAFGKYISSQETSGWNTSGSLAGKYEFDQYVYEPVTVFCISNYPEGSISDSGNVYTSVVSAMMAKLRGAKKYGIVYKVFYDEKVDKCITTQLYIPTSLYFNPEQEMKCVLLFPGANGRAAQYNTADKEYNLTQGMQMYAEERGYVLATVESYINSGQYGDPTGPIGRFPVTNPDDPENPWGKEEGWLADIEMSGKVAIDTLDYAMETCPTINPDKVFAFGCSMGSMGAFSMGINYNDRFAGLVGTAGITEIDHWDVSKIGETPFLFIGGTEDSNGLDFMLYAVEKLDAMLPNFEYRFTGGAVHGAEWKPYVEDIFDWFDRILES